MGTQIKSSGDQVNRDGKGNDKYTLEYSLEFFILNQTRHCLLY